jgi:hypothetical protein
LQPDTERITPVEHKPTHDRAPEELALGSPLWLRDDLVDLIGEEQVHSRLIAHLLVGERAAQSSHVFCKVIRICRRGKSHRNDGIGDGWGFADTGARILTAI